MKFHIATPRLNGLLYILTTFILTFFVSCTTEDEIQPEQTELTVGAILSLNGQWSTLGLNSQAALNMAASEINEYFQSTGYNARIEVQIYDSGLDPFKALQHLETAKSEGIRIVIGPQSSAELSALKRYADEHNILVISNGSTAGSLSLPGDNIYRFCPDGTLEGQALARKIYADGVRGLVTVARSDVGNVGLEEDLRSAFESLGGTVYGIEPYGEDETVFSAVIADIESSLTTAIEVHGMESSAVYIAAFDEGVTLFDQAVDHSLLTSVNWYGGDGLVSSEALVNNPDAAEFAIATQFIAPNFALPENARPSWEPLSNAIEAETGLTASAFALACYDALWVAALTTESLQHSSGEFAELKQAFRDRAKIYFGATGPTQLNENGDRSIAAFGFWGVEKVNDTFQWKLVSSSE